MSDQQLSPTPVDDSVKEQLKANFTQQMQANVGSTLKTRRGPPPRVNNLMTAPSVAKVMVARQKQSLRYTNIQGVRRTAKGKVIVWQAEDSTNENAIVYVSSFQKPGQDAAWVNAPPDETGRRFVGIEKATRPDLVWGTEGCCWWQAADTDAEVWPTVMYAESVDADTVPDDKATWIDKDHYGRRMDALVQKILAKESVELKEEARPSNTSTPLSPEERLKRVDSAMSHLLRRARNDAINAIESEMGGRLQVDGRWYLPSREVVTTLLDDHVQGLTKS